MDGVGPSSKNNWNQPGGQTCEFGGAVIVHVLPEHENAGKIVRWPMLLPCVEASAPSSEARMFAVLPDVTAMVIDCPYAQSVFVTLKVGRASPDRR